MSKNIARYELIGLNAEVVNAKNESLIGVKGKIVDETKFTIVIENENGQEKKLLKEQITLKMKIKDKVYKINGEILIGRPEDRLKKKFRF